MKALVFRRSIPRYALLKLLGGRFRGLRTRLAPLSLERIDPPPLPSPRWARVRPMLAGICGSDLATVCAKGSPYLAPVTSMPFVLGHELVGVVSEVGTGVTSIKVKDRVVLHPALGCRVRGLDPLCVFCAAGRDALCRRVTEGDIAAGIQTGYCRDTGGGFSEELVAHESQLYPVPDAISDQAAVLIEPFSCALHGVFRARPAPQGTVLVIGCGAIGLLTIAALRATGCRARICAVARYEHQRKHARSFGADEFLADGGRLADRYAQWADRLDARVLPAPIGKPMVIGGADVTFDCVATSTSIDDAFRFTRAGGTLVLVGMPGIPRHVDWTPLWFKELNLHAAYAYGPERIDGAEMDTFDLAIHHMHEWGERLSALVGRPFPLASYRAAFDQALGSGRSGVVKTVFAPEDS